MEVLNPIAPHTHTVILLHGRDSTASEFKPDFFESESSDGRTLPEIFPGVKWMFPSADMVYSRRFKTHISQWFDMHKTERPHDREDEQDLITSFQRIGETIKREASIIGFQNIFLGGISQGAAIAIHSLLAQNYRLCGFIGISSWFPKRERTLEYFLGQRQACDQIETPAFVVHNQNDETISLKYGKELRNTMKDVGMRVEWHSYETGDHWLNEPEGVDDLVRWMGRRMGRRSVDESSRQAQSYSSQKADYFSAHSEREVAILAKRIRDNMSDERKRELHAASVINRRDDPCFEGRRPSTDPIDMFCMSRAQRQLSSCSNHRDMGRKMKLINAS